MLDFVQNNNPVSVYRALAEFEAQGDFPEFLKDYQLPDSQSLNKYASSAFADPDTRSFPILNPASTLLSAMCYFGDMNDDPRIGDEIVKAAEVQGIADYVQRVRDMPRMEKQASTIEPEYALVLDHGTHQEAYLPISNTYQVQESARSLASAIYERKLPLIKAAEACRILVKQASDLDVDPDTIPHIVQSFAEHRLPDALDMDIQLSIRRRLVDVETGDLYTEIFKNASDQNIEACVEMVEDLDRTHIDFQASRYTGIEDAWTVFHSGMTAPDFEKLASEYMVLTFGDERLDLPVSAITNIPDSMIKAAFRSDTANAILEARKNPVGWELGAKIDALSAETKNELLNLASTYSE